MKLNFDKKAKINLIICIGIIVLGVVFDQITKAVFVNLDEKGVIPLTVIPGVASFVLAYNNGAAWGSFGGSSIMFFCLTVLAVPAFVLIMLYRLKYGKISAFGFAFVLSGALGNAVDRLLLGDGFFNGEVRDFLQLEFLGPLSFICNLADILLGAGVVLLIIGMAFTDKDAIFKKEVHENAEEEDTVDNTREQGHDTQVLPKSENNISEIVVSNEEIIDESEDENERN